MGHSLFLNLLHNTTFLLMLALIFKVFPHKFKNRILISSVLIGVCIGAAGMITIATAELHIGITLVDARSILISVAGAFFGVVPTVIAGLMMIVFRIIIGGASVVAGILVIIVSGSIGIIWHNIRLNKIINGNSKYSLEFYILGLIVNMGMILCMLALPEDQMILVIKSITLPTLIINPIGTYLLCILMLEQIQKTRLLKELNDSESKYRKLAENTSDVLWACDLNLHHTYVSPSIEKMTGITSTVFTSLAVEEYIPSEELVKIKQIIAIEFEKENEKGCDPLRTFKLETQFYRANGSRVWVSMHVSFVRDDRGQIIGFNGVTRDINERKKTEKELAESQRRLIEAQRMASVGNWELDLATNILWASDEAYRIYGIIHDSPYVPFRVAQECVCPEYRSLLAEKLSALIKNNEKYDLEYKVNRLKTGEVIFVRSKATRLVDHAGKALKIMGIIQDITTQKKREDEILFLSYYDQLTGSYNRRFYDEAINRIDNKLNLPISVLIGDVSGLKIINESYGHQFGDELIVKASNIIKENCREDDIIIRWAGDEFIILLPKTTAVEVEELINKINNASKGKNVKEIEVDISFGSYTKENEEELIESIIVLAEKNLSKNKLIRNADRKGNAIQSIINALHEKNPREELHSKRVSKYCIDIAESMNLTQNEISKIKIASILHDIGKIALEEGILNKEGPLTASEWADIKRHPEIGYRIIGSAYEMIDIAEYTLAHHERWDGKGYPKGLVGEQIPMISRIIGIADAFDAMTSVRTYGQRKSKEEAANEIRRCAGTQFDPEIALIFVNKVI